MLVDTHVHFKSTEQAETQILEAKGRGVEFVVAIGSDVESSKTANEIASSIGAVKSSVGVHPHKAEPEQGKLDEIRELAREAHVAAIGECGLDYYYMNSPKDIQQQVFTEQIEIAKELGKPLIVHSRDAMGDTLSILKTHGVPERGCIMHCFSGNQEDAEKLIELGCYLGFGGVITFKKSSVAHVSARVPLSKVVLETDSPYLSPEPIRGKTNNPANLIIIARKLADLRGSDLLNISRETTKNASRLFKF